MVCTQAEPHSMCPVFGHRVPRPIWPSFEAPRSHRGPCATDKGQFGAAARGGHLSPGQSKKDALHVLEVLNPREITSSKAAPDPSNEGCDVASVHPC